VELRRILLHTSIQGKALFLTLSSSGMRIGEALKLKLEDFDFEKQPCQVNIRGEYTKTGNPRITFISSEAVMAIQEWLKVRSKYLLAASRRSHKYGKSATDDRIFPFENVTAYEIWKHALEKAQFLKHDSSTNRLTLHPHVLRKFFRTRLGTVIPVDVTEALMGHEEYLTEVYRKYNPEDLAKFYLQGEAALLIFTEAEEVSKLRVEVEDKSKQLDAVIRSLVTENADLKRRIQNTEKKLDDLEKLVREAKQLI